MSGARIHVCAHQPCVSTFTASKYGQFPPPIHGLFLQCNPPTDLSSLVPAPKVVGHSESPTGAIPSTGEQPTSSNEHAPTAVEPTPSVVCPTLTSEPTPTVVELAPSVVGPTPTSELSPTVVVQAPVEMDPAPSTPSGAGGPNELAAAELSQPADSQIGGPQISVDDELRGCDDIPAATPCQEDDPHYGEGTCADIEVEHDGSLLTSPQPESPLSQTTEILHLLDVLNEHEPPCAHGGGPDHELVEPVKVVEPAEIVNPDGSVDVASSPDAAQPELATLPEIEKPKVAELKGSADCAADAVASPPPSAPLVTNASAAPPAPPSSSQSHICPVILEVLQLAEELRKPVAYCGPYVFVLFCLYYGTRMKIWYGDQCKDIVDEYIPWASEHCKATSHIDAIYCAFKVDPETGVASIRPAGPDVPINELNHYVATISLRNCLVTGTACPSNLEAFYLPKGQCPLPTVAEGNCSLDICVQSRGLPQTPDEFQDMRDRLAG